MRHLLECFLGTRPKGEIRKCLKGGKGKGPAVWPLRTFGQKVVFKDVWVQVG